MTHSPSPYPAMRNRDREMIPKALLRAMLALAVSSLAIVSFAVLTDRAHVGQPQAAPITAQRTLVLEGGGPKAIRILDAEGAVIADMDNGGFITVVQNGLERERMKNGVDPAAPVELVAYANGRLTLLDPHSGWSVELASFGAGNKAAFERLLTR